MKQLPPTRRRQHTDLGLVAALLTAIALLISPSAFAGPTWNFVVSGDSRNCGDVVMPSIAAAARANQASFYWHLGDLRSIYDFDEDFKALHPKTTIAEYLSTAWLDFQRNQIEQFGAMPFFLGIGNHETIPPKTRDEFVVTFADWLNAPEIREQRLKDDPHEHKVRTYYHWIRDGVDFINLDNATPDQFDATQMKWLGALLDRDRRDTNIRALVVGMHEALPESLTRSHSMSASSAGIQRPLPNKHSSAAYDSGGEMSDERAVTGQCRRQDRAPSRVTGFH